MESLCNVEQDEVNSNVAHWSKLDVCRKEQGNVKEMWKVKGKRSKGEKTHVCPMSVLEKAGQLCMKLPHMGIESSNPSAFCHCATDFFSSFCHVVTKKNTALTVALGLISCTQNFGKSQLRLCGHQREGFLTESISPTGKC